MIRIITDTASDLSFECMKENGIKILPYTISFGEKEYTDRIPKDDLEVVDTKKFYELMDNEKEFPKTAQVTMNQFLKAYKEIKEENPEDEIVVITLAKALSGAFEAALLAKDESGFEDISVIDSKGATATEALLVYKALDFIAAGLSRIEIEEKLNELSARDEFIFYVDGLDHLRRGGRISSVKSLIGGVLNVKPLLKLGKDGVITSFDKGKGEKIAFKKLVNYAKENRKPDNKLIIAHGDCPEKANILKEMLEEALGETVDEVLIMGPVIGTHAGRGAILITY